MNDREQLIEQLNDSRDALIRARDRATSEATRDFLDLIAAKVDERILKLQAGDAMVGHERRPAPRESLPRALLARLLRVVPSPSSGRGRTLSQR